MAVLIIAAVYKAAEVRDDLGAFDDTTARDAVSDAQNVAVLASSISNLSIYIGIVMPHLQILGARVASSLENGGTG